MDAVITTLVDYVENLEFTDLDEAEIEAVRVRLVDSFGCMVGGMVSPPGVIARSHAGRITGTPSASVLGGRESALDETAFAKVHYLSWGKTDAVVRPLIGRSSLDSAEI